jgi:non-ribosomal peptide synthetase component E (peptide arylation enzyme)
LLVQRPDRRREDGRDVADGEVGDLLFAGPG